ncbi:MAG: iron permease, partial [Clostridiales bacterium]
MIGKIRVKRFAVVFLTIALVFSMSFSFAAKKKKYNTWQEVATDMALVFDEALDNIESEEYKAAYDNMNDAYFGYYEVQG